MHTSHRPLLQVRRSSGSIGLLVLLSSLAAASANAQWLGPTGATNLMSYTNGNVFVGNSSFFPNPVARFSVADNASNSRVITSYAYAGTPVSGVRTTAIWGETNNPQGRALQGFNFATTGNGAGIWAENASTQGYGLMARATATTGVTISGVFENSSQDGVGVHVTTSSSSGGVPISLYVDNSNTAGWCGFFLGSQNYFAGKVSIGDSAPTHALHVIDAGATATIYGEANSSSSTNVTIASSAVQGIHTNTTPNAWCAGVRGMSLGTGLNGIGVVGYHAGQGIGVWGSVGDSAGYAGYFNGKTNVTGSFNASGAATFGNNVSVTGNLSKGGGSFKIDHPLDPANKYLYHSFVESPDMKNIYDGLAETDGSGYATITMPDYFEALNRDFRYQLTIIDESDSGFALAKVVRGIKDGEFTIRTSMPNQKVSWQVTGIRRDAFAEKHRIPTTVDKAPQDRGLYLHPDAFGLDETKNLSRNTGRPDLDASLFPKTLPTPASPETTTKAKPRVIPVNNEPPLTPVISRGN